MPWLMHLSAQRFMHAKAAACRKAACRKSARHQLSRSEPPKAPERAPGPAAPAVLMRLTLPSVGEGASGVAAVAVLLVCPQREYNKKGSLRGAGKAGVGAVPVADRAALRRRPPQAQDARHWLECSLLASTWMILVHLHPALLQHGRQLHGASLSV